MRARSSLVRFTKRATRKAKMRVKTVADRVMDSKHPPAVQLHGSIPRGVKTSSLRYTIAPQAIRARTSAPEPPPDFGFKIHGQIGRDYRSGSHHEKIPPFHINVFSKQNKPCYRKNRNQECRALIPRVM